MSDRALLERHLAVNLFGTYGVTQAFLPLLTRSRGAIVNVLSVAAVAALPFTRTYSISKAAALNLTQSLRAPGRTGRAGACRPGRPRGHRDDPIPRHPEGLSGVRRAGIFDGVENGEEEIFPDPLSASMAESWRSGRPRHSNASSRRSSRQRPSSHEQRDR